MPFKVKISNDVSLKNDTVGIYYELPNSKIALTFGFENKGAIILYRFDDLEGTRKVSNDVFQTWIPRRDLSDFINASDPRLPYDFDLHFDIKYMSELKYALENDSIYCSTVEIEDMMKDYSITIKT